MDTLYPGRGWNIKRAPEKLGKVDSEDLQNRPLTCPKCSGKMKVISVIGDEDVIEKILKHLSLWEVNPPEVWRVKPRPPPKATGPTKIAEYSIDHSTSQLHASDKWLLCRYRIFGGLPALGVVYPEGHPAQFFKLGGEFRGEV